MRGIAALSLDDPGLLRALGPTEPGQLERRLRDRIELERLRKETENDLAELRAAASKHVRGGGGGLGGAATIKRNWLQISCI